MARTKTVEIIAGTSFIWKGKLVRAGTKIKVPEEFYIREIALQTKRNAKLHKLANSAESEEESEPTPPLEEPPSVPSLEEPQPQPQPVGGGTSDGKEMNS